MSGAAAATQRPSGPRATSGLSLRSWWITTTPSRLTPTSSSKVVTPSSSARAKPGNVFSGAWPRAPRWPCRSKLAALSTGKVSLSRNRRRRSEPDPGGDRNDPEEKMDPERLADEYRGEERRGDRVDRHGVGHARRRGALERVDPKIERRGAAEDAETEHRDPLRRGECAGRREAARNPREQDARARAATHSGGQEPEHARARHQRARPDVVE